MVLISFIYSIISLSVDYTVILCILMCIHGYCKSSKDRTIFLQIILLTD